MVHSGSESSFVVDVKTKQGVDQTWVELKETALKKFVEVFSQGGVGVLRYQGHLYVLNDDNLREHILIEDHSLRYCIHLGSTKMYCD